MRFGQMTQTTARPAPTDEEIDEELSARRAAHDEAVAEHERAIEAVAELQRQLEDAERLRDTTTDSSTAVAADADARRHRVSIPSAEAAERAAASKRDQITRYFEGLADIADELYLADAKADALRVIAPVASAAEVHAARAAHYARDIDLVPADVRQLQRFLRSVPGDLARLEGARPAIVQRVAAVMAQPLPPPEPRQAMRLNPVRHQLLRP